MHVLIQCMSARKAGFDAMNARLQSLMIALVYNKPYSISRYLFHELCQQIDGVQRDKFLLYPRFVMLIISHLLPDLPQLDNTVLVSVIDRRIFADCRAIKGNRPADQQPHETPLFGHLVDPEYVAPPNDGWLDVEPEAKESVPEGSQARQEVLEDVLIQAEQPAPQGSGDRKSVV